MIIIYDSLKALKKDNIELLEPSNKLDFDDYVNILVSPSMLNEDIERRFIRYDKLIPNNRTVEFIKKNTHHPEVIKEYLKIEIGKYDVQSGLCAIHLVHILKNIRIVFHEVDPLYVDHIKDFLMQQETDVKIFFSSDI